jgi:uncharacterized protein YndB with AHSA1/START domain
VARSASPASRRLVDGRSGVYSFKEAGTDRPTDTKELAVTEIPPVEVTMHLPAAPSDVFAYFTDPALMVQWMGSEATLEPVPGGVYHLRMADGFEAAGQFAQVEPPHRVVFTWGFASDEAAKHTKGELSDASVSAMPPGSTRVTVTLQPQDGGTHLTLRHEDLPSAELRAGNRLGWETYLPRLAVRAAGGDPGPDPHA